MNKSISKTSGATLAQQVTLSGSLFQTFFKDLNKQVKRLTQAYQTPSNLPEEKKVLTSIVESVDDLLIESKIKSNFDIDFNPKLLIRQVFYLYSKEAQAHQTDLNLDFSDNFPERIVLNTTLFTQIILFLVHNAVASTRKGTVAITCFQQDSQLIVNISNSGKEICQNETMGMNTLLERYQLGLEAGTDLGIIAACWLTRKLEGDLQIKSEARLGNIVNLKIPVLDNPVELRESDVSGNVESKRIDAPKDHSVKQVVFKGLHYLQEEMDRLSEAIEGRSVGQIQKILHELKGFPAGFGLNRIYSKIKNLESALKIEILDKAALENQIEDLKKDIFEGLNEFHEMETFTEQDEYGLTSELSDYNAIKVLVAEDNLMNQEIIAYMLKSIGFSFRLVKTGVEVVEELKQQRYDLLLLDMRMPEMGGFETLLKIRSNPEWENLPVIAVTAENSNEEEARFRKAGCDDFVAKPIDINELTRKIDKLINKSSIGA